MAMPTMASYGRKLWDLLCVSARLLDEMNGPQPRSGRVRATFTETQLAKQCLVMLAGGKQRAVATEYYVEVCSEDRSHQTRVDFVSLAGGQMLASCEVKGPARPTIYKRGTKNFYEQLKGSNRVPYGIKPDLRKQHSLAREHPDAEHYVLWILENPDDIGFDLGLSALCARLRSEVTTIIFEEVARTAIVNENGPLWLVMCRVH